eukprot:s275_g19.t1
MQSPRWHQNSAPFERFPCSKCTADHCPCDFCRTLPVVLCFASPHCPMEINEALTQDYSKDYRRNLLYVFISYFFSMSLSALTLGPIFDAYLLNIGGQHGNKLVGAMESTRGILQLIFAYPIGSLSDKMSKVRLLKWDLVFWTIGLALLVLGIAGDSLPLMFVGMGVWAPASQCWNSTAQVVVGESATPAKRTKVLSRLTTLRLVAIASGPMLQGILLLISGKNHWGNSLLRVIILSGVALWPGCLWLLRLKDLPPLEQTEGNAQSRWCSTFSKEDLDRPLLGIRRRWWLAVWIELLSFISLFGAGMTVKFFPLFFRIDYHFTPFEVCMLSFVYPLGIAGMVELCSRVSKHLGRFPTVIFFQFTGTACLWALCYIRPLAIVLPLFLLRGALMNARGPLVRAITMDLVHSEMRGRWNSIQSLSMFAWSGSAALGGYLADVAGDYRFTFVVTAGIYTVGFFLHLPLLLIYPKEHKEPPPQQAQERSLPNLQDPVSTSSSGNIGNQEASGGCGGLVPRTS